MVKSKYVPEKGDLVWLDFDPQTGHEQKGRRPAVCVSQKTYNQNIVFFMFRRPPSSTLGHPSAL